jgi:choline dehydrogenase-like flavoprotein
MRAVVVGSGPAGTACAAALLARGAEVTMVDAAIALEPERRAVVEQMRATAPAAWSASALALVKEGMTATGGGVVLKRQFGSDFAYRGAAEHLHFESVGAALQPSLARGGFSTVWGAAALPYAEEEFDGWPISRADLAPHYEAVLRWMPLAGAEDDLAADFPLYTPQPGELASSPQATRLLARLRAVREKLRDAGVSFGQARLAVQAGAAGCVRCGLCMYGCPYGWIYESSATVERLRTNAGLRYEAGVVVDGVEERGAAARLTGHHVATGETWELAADRVFLAAGVVPGARILLASQGGGAVRVKDSAYFIVPLLSAWAADAVRGVDTHTLSQVFIEIQDAAVSARRVHLQLYTYSDLITGAFRSVLGSFAFDALLRWLERRTMIVQGYLHSDESGGMDLRVEGRGRDARVQLTGQQNPATRAAIQCVLRKLRRLAPVLGAALVPGACQTTQPGRGFHSGGTWPMSAQPHAGASDVLGRPFGWSRVHLVDASVLPAIPATTITLSVMANAHRIGTLAAL